MGYYEDNLEIIEKRFPEIYEGIVKKDRVDSMQVCVGDALDGENFLAIVQGERVIPLNSTYHPTHEAERYVAQFEEIKHDIGIVLLGFGNGLIVEKLLEEKCPVQRCIVYEPSIDILKRAVETYDLKSILENENFILFTVNSVEKLEKYLDGITDYRNWRHYRFATLTHYKELFVEEYALVKDVFKRVIDSKRANLNTLVTHSKVCLKNEVYALRKMIDSKDIHCLEGKIPENVPCIIVGAGPSLEKNVEILQQAKGRCFIFCVDSAVPYLMKRGIIPDMMCTIDPVKGAHHFENPGTEQVPLAITTASNYHIVDGMRDANFFYFMTTTGYYERLFREKGVDIGYVDGGGSVATVCFRLAVDLGFKTIILIGQDLAFTDDKTHAGKGMVNEKDFLGNATLVDGYFGKKVLTRADYKFYIDWYNLYIPELQEQVVVNATEGGAKLKGTIQMPLQEAVNQYCIQEYNFAELLEQSKEIWETVEEKKDFYLELKSMRMYFNGFKRRLKEGISDAERAIYLVKRGNYSINELEKLEKKLERITQEIETSEGMTLLIARIIEMDVEISDDLNDSDENLEQESIRLYQKMKTYLNSTLEAVEELIPMWDESMKYINDKYHFDV